MIASLQRASREQTMDQENLPAPSNPLGMEGVEFIEYTTREPLALGALLQQFGFQPVARHRSREVMLYRQGVMNVIVDADPASVRESSRSGAPSVGAIAFRVRNAAYAHRRALELGAWDMPTRAAAMEMNIPGIHGVGDTLIYFVDRHDDLSIYDVDFLPIAGAHQTPPALAGLHWFGVCRRCSRTAARTGSTSIARCSASNRCSAGSTSACCPRGRC